MTAGFRYCPQCGAALAPREAGGAVRPACPACDFVLYLDPKVVVAVAVGHAGRVLLGRRAINPGRGLWSFPGGYVDRGEAVDPALRETREETGLAVRLTGLLGVYRARPGGPTSCWPTPPRPSATPRPCAPNPKRCWGTGLLRARRGAPAGLPARPGNSGRVAGRRGLTPRGAPRV